MTLFTLPHCTQMHSIRVTLACLFLALVALGCQPDAPEPPASTTADSTYETDVPYVTTPQPVVNQMLEVAEVSNDDVVYDLGSGDGRIVLTAVQRYNAQRAVGIELVPELVRTSRSFARLAGVDDRALFRRKDLFDVNLHDATVVTMYLYPEVIEDVWPKLMRQLDPGDHIVSHNYTGNVRPHPDTTLHIGEHTVYAWTVPATRPTPLVQDTTKTNASS